ncbi:FG-GAP-like repeat-containing protein [Nocardioides sp. CN2-186]|uniref:FG-GAP-like repeat-containing protein n=1 Tax=Nocardioides tweenelious TaxID=3156607 RepID=UPI0032B5A08A
MPPSKIRFVTACQQLLALGVVLAALTPAASVVSLDVVRSSPDSDGLTTTTDGLSAEMSAYTKAALKPSKVPTEVVDPTVHEVALTAPAGASQRERSAVEKNVVAHGSVGRTKADALADDEVTSVPSPVVGYGAVGVTWAHGIVLPEDGISLKVRTRTDDTWSKWMDLEYHDDHGPDPGSAEARHARPGTDALLVGDVDDVQVQIDTTRGTLPADLKLAVIDPGKAKTSAVEKPALDTNEMDGGTESAEDVVADAATLPGSIETDAGEGTDGSDQISLQAATFTPKPVIYSRAQWGADESMRQASSLHYYEVHAGFVHHTVNANDYSRAEVPAILRSIYAYHTKSRGWSDIGYNFLVDRFGRIWEGRYGGIDRPVVGAHTLNYNDYSFAMSAIGNYDIKQPSQAMVEAYGALFAWKLSLHGVDASSTKQWVGSKYFEAINGHRDAAATACPGRYLYAKIPEIRQLAAQAQRGWSGRELESDLASSQHPDLIVRRASDDHAVILPTGGLTAFGPAATAASGLADSDTTVVSPDLTGDGIDDLLVSAADGTAQIRPGTGSGTFGDAQKKVLTSLAGHDLVTAVGDLNGDGRNDLVARAAGTGRLDAYLGRKKTGFKVKHLANVWGDYNLLVGAGDLDGDGRADLLARDPSGTLWLHPGKGNGTFTARVQVAGSWKGYSTITGYGDFDGDGHSDLFVRSADTGYAAVIPSHGDGTFGHALGPLTGFAKVGKVVGAAQVAGDATPDVVVRGSAGRVVVLTNKGTTEMHSPIDTGVTIAGANAVFNAGDWDRDGHGDMITRNAADGALYLRRGDGQGHFGPATKIGTGFKGVGLLAAVGDMTGDGWPDLMGQPKGAAIRIYPGNGMSGLKTSYVAHGAIDAGKQVAVGRWNADGAPDSLFRKGAKLTLYPGNGPGGLTSGKPLSLDLSPYDWVVGISDEGLTGHPDLVVREKKTGYLWLVPGTNSGFGARRFLAEGMGGYDLAG